MIRVLASFWLFFCLAMPGCGPEPGSGRLSISTGAEGGVSSVLGGAFAEVCRAELGHSVVALPSAGSVENMRRLMAGEVEFALVQSDTPGDASVRTVAALYREWIHVFVRAESSERVEDLLGLQGRRLAVGAEGSGTAVVVNDLLDHLGLPEEETPRRPLGFAAGADALLAGEVDALFALASAPFPAGERLLDGGKVKLASLGNPSEVGCALDGICAANPFLVRGVIARQTYGQRPRARRGTVGVHALLVTREDVPEPMVRRVTQALFENKVALTERTPVAAQMREGAPQTSLRFPLHDGAAAYYRREEPSFFVEYAEAMSFGLTLMLLLGSGAITLRAWLLRRKKNRIDAYYLEVEAIASALDELDAAELTDRRRRLNALRRRAFADLVSERLEANESFTIFQDFLLAELHAVQEHLRTRAQTS